MSGKGEKNYLFRYGGVYSNWRNTKNIFQGPEDLDLINSIDFITDFIELTKSQRYEDVEHSLVASFGLLEKLFKEQKVLSIAEDDH